MQFFFSTPERVEVVRTAISTYAGFADWAQNGTDNISAPARADNIMIFPWSTL
jgi:hypothetical protein